MQQWEYKQIRGTWTLASGQGKTHPELREAGLEGWELVSVNPSPEEGGRTLLGHLKRPLPGRSFLSRLFSLGRWS